MSGGPRTFDAVYRLGLRYGQAGKFEEAETLMGEAAALNPAAPEAYLARGYALQRLARAAEAIQCYDTVLRLKPDSTEGLLNRAASLSTLRRYKEASADYAALLARDPDYPFARGNRLFADLHCCDWSTLETETRAIAQALRAGKPAVAPFDGKALGFSPEDDSLAARIWVASQCPPAAQELWRGEVYGHQRIRLAYVADDLPGHPAGPLLAGVVARHDRARFETIAISFGPERANALQTELRKRFDRYIEIRNESDAEVAARLRQMEVDIAVDLMGFTQGCRPGIFARRPAPVQVNYLGFPGTMGAAYMDYLIADRIVIAPEDAPHYSEKIVTLPECFFPGDRASAEAPPPSRASAGLPENGFVFCAFNNVYKIAPAMFAVWMRLLQAVDAGVLWLSGTSENAANNLRREASLRGVDPARLVFAPFVEGRQAHLARLKLADLFLDTLPYNAHATANDALASGVPVLTCKGSAFAGRVAASLVTAAGLPELAAPDLATYEALALQLARDAPALEAVTAKLAAGVQTSALFDTARITRHLEAAYSAMEARARRGESPISFAVPPSA